MPTVTERTSIMRLRKLREEIRQTVNLVGSGERITERPGSWWTANMETREVEWIPMWPFPPYLEIDTIGIRYCVPHEASHLKWSGLYETKRIKDSERARFHRFVNAVEDVRVDRLSARQFGSFFDAQVKVRTMLRRQQTGTNPEGWSLVDAVGLNCCFAFEIGLAPQGTTLAIDASVKLWPKLSRVANLRSTQEVASALEPIFRKLVEVEQAEAQRKQEEAEAAAEAFRKEMQERWERSQQQPAGEGEGAAADGNSDSEGPTAEPGNAADEDAVDEENPGEGKAEPDAAHADDDGSGSGVSGSPPDAEQKGDPSSGADSGQDPGGEANTEQKDPLAGLDKVRTDGADSPTDTPVKSDGAPGTEPAPLGQELEGMEADTDDDETRRQLQEARRRRNEQKQLAQKLAEKQTGKRAYPTPVGRVRYDDQRAELRGDINTLANRMKAVLRQNAMEAGSTGHRRGRFDPAKAYRLKTGNPKVFKQPGHTGGLDYAFGILVDVSSSMGRDIRVNGKSTTEREAAFAATVLVAEALELAGLGLFIVAWSSVIPHVKTLAEPLANHRAQLGEAFWAGGATVEAPALSLAIDEMKKARGRRMIITITDGETKGIDESMELLAELEHDGVMPVTIRIGGNPSSHYRHGYSVAHANELTVLLPRLINQVVRRGA